MVNKSNFLSDRPTGRKQSYSLFNEDTRHQIQEIAQHLIAPLQDGNEAEQFDSMAFAVYGDWGAGKSSFLECVKDESLELLTQKAKDYPDVNPKARIKFCFYNASVYSHTQTNVRDTLTVTVVNKLIEGNSNGVIKAIRDVFGGTDKHPECPECKKEEDPYLLKSKIALYKTIQSGCNDLGGLADFPAMLSGEITNIEPYKDTNDDNVGNARKMAFFGDARPGVLVVFVDDLDRCSVETVAEVLRVVYHWSTVKNLFFLLAVNQTLLLDAVQKIVPNSPQVSASPDYALEKYIQHHYELPSLDDDKRLKTFIDNLLSEFESEAFRNAFSKHNKLYELLQTGLNRKTPRAIKKCLNFVCSDISHKYTKLEEDLNPKPISKEKKNINELSEPQGTDSEPVKQEAALRDLVTPERLVHLFLRDCKEKILEHNWSDVYKLYYAPMKKPGYRTAQLKTVWQELEYAVQEYTALGKIPDDELLRQRLALVAHFYPNVEKFLSFFLDDEERKLINFLACPPFLSDSEKLSKTSSGSVGKASLLDPAVLLSTRNFETEFQQLYADSTAAADATPPRIEEALGYSLKAAVLIENNIGRIPLGNANILGNLAFQAERFHANDLADLLFSLVLQLDPNHGNNLQRYISFIADTQRLERYDTAITCLRKLETDQPTFKAAFRIALKAQMHELLAENKKRDLEITEEDLQLLYTRVGENEEYGYAMLAASNMHSYDVMKNLFDIGLEQAGNVSQAYNRIRVLADYVPSTQKTHAHAVDEGLEIYRRLLEHSSSIDPEDVADVYHNYAVGLYRQDIDDEAGRMWYKAYELNRTDVNIQQAYTSYLTRAGKPDLAQQVNNSEPVTESIENTLQPHNKKLPEHFSDAEHIDQIFERLAKLEREQK